MSYFIDIINSNEEINLRYMNSKLPKFIQKRIITHYKRKLIKIIDRINPHNIPAGVIYDFCRVLFDRSGTGAKYDDISVSPIYLDKIIVGYVLRINIVLDNLIYITGELDISKSRVNEDYLMKLVVHTWSNGSNTSNYHTPLTRYQEISYDVCHELKIHNLYTKYREAIMIKIIDSLYESIHKFLIEEVNKTERRIT